MGLFDNFKDPEWRERWGFTWANMVGFDGSDVIANAPIIGPIATAMDYIKNDPALQHSSRIIISGSTMRERKLLEKHGIKCFGNNSERNPFKTGFFVDDKDIEAAKSILRKNRIHFETDDGN